MDAMRLFQRALASLKPLAANLPVAEPAAGPQTSFSGRRAGTDPNIIDVEAHDITARADATQAPVYQPGARAASPELPRRKPPVRYLLVTFAAHRLLVKA